MFPAFERRQFDAGNTIRCPLLVLWGANGVIDKCFQPLDDWARVAADVRGHSVASGHYIPEEIPIQLADELEAVFESA